MKNMMLGLFAGLLTVAGQVAAFGQEPTNRDWEFIPGLTLVSYFPGKPIVSNTRYGFKDEYRYSGLGLNFQLRSFYRELPQIAFTLNGGVNWFDSPDRRIVYAGAQGDGIGTVLTRASFRTFPIAIGVEGILPQSRSRAVMFFAGGNVAVHFVDGHVDMGQQMKLGYAVGGGFAVKVFEFGVRYYSFSDIRNIGAHIGLRFPRFGLD